MEAVPATDVLSVSLTCIHTYTEARVCVHANLFLELQGQAEDQLYKRAWRQLNDASFTVLPILSPYPLLLYLFSFCFYFCFKHASLNQKTHKRKPTTIIDLEAFMLCLEKHWPQILSVTNILKRGGFKQGISRRQLLWKLGIYFLFL